MGFPVTGNADYQQPPYSEENTGSGMHQRQHQAPARQMQRSRVDTWDERHQPVQHEYGQEAEQHEQPVRHVSSTAGGEGVFGRDRDRERDGPSGAKAILLPGPPYPSGGRGARGRGRGRLTRGRG